MTNFSWQTPEYHHIKKTNDWYWTVGIISIALVITALLFGNVLFAVVLAISSFTLTMFASRRPEIIEVEVDERGIRVDHVLYPYPTLDSFSIDEKHSHGPRLMLKSKKAVVPLISIPLNLENPEELKNYLASRLKEESFERGIMQTLLEHLGF